MSDHESADAQEVCVCVFLHIISQLYLKVTVELLAWLLSVCLFVHL